MFGKWKVIAENDKWRALQRKRDGKIKWVEKCSVGHQPRPPLPEEKRDGKNGKLRRVRAVLKSGQIIEFDLNSDSIEGVTSLFDGFLETADGSFVHIAKSEIAAMVVDKACDA
jgi:hypothetical protein